MTRRSKWRRSPIYARKPQPQGSSRGVWVRLRERSHGESRNHYAENPSYEGLWGSGEEYAYEVLNFADGKRNANRFATRCPRNTGLSRLEMVIEYLRALEKIGVVEQVK